MVKPSLKKQPTSDAGHNTKPPDLIGEKLIREAFPPHFCPDRGKSQGNPMVELATPKGTQQSDQGNE